MAQNDGMIVTMNPYEQQMILAEVRAKLAEVENQVSGGKILPEKEALDAPRETCGV